MNQTQHTATQPLVVADTADNALVESNLSALAEGKKLATIYTVDGEIIKTGKFSGFKLVAQSAFGVKTDIVNVYSQNGRCIGYVSEEDVDGFMAGNGSAMTPEGGWPLKWSSELIDLFDLRNTATYQAALVALGSSNRSHVSIDDVSPRKLFQSEYLFYIEGLDREIWQVGESEKSAHKAVWDSLGADDRDRVVQMECIDQRLTSNTYSERNLPKTGYDFYKMSLRQAGAYLMKIVGGRPGPKDHERVAKACMQAGSIDEAKQMAGSMVEYQVDIDDAFACIENCINGRLPLSLDQIRQLQADENHIVNEGESSPSSKM